jgi:hypothetical protein
MIDYIIDNGEMDNQFLREKKMVNKAVLLSEIARLTGIISTKFPGLYQFLDENPITIPISAHPKMDVDTLSNYLNDLKAILKQYAKSHHPENA